MQYCNFVGVDFLYVKQVCYQNYSFNGDNTMRFLKRGFVYKKRYLQHKQFQFTADDMIIFKMTVTKYIVFFYILCSIVISSAAGEYEKKRDKINKYLKNFKKKEGLVILTGGKNHSEGVIVKFFIYLIRELAYLYSNI